jgi:L-ascorbate metabolism protein UlaG (beta-lactamase superfamily)
MHDVWSAYSAQQEQCRADLATHQHSTHITDRLLVAQSSTYFASPESLKGLFGAFPGRTEQLPNLELEEFPRFSEFARRFDSIVITL